MQFQIPNLKFQIPIQKIIFFLLLSLPLPLTPLPYTRAYAQSGTQTLRVSPVIIPVTLLPGKESTQKISLENLSDTPLPLHGGFSDFEQASEDGGYIIKDKVTNSLASWMQLSEENVIIPAHTKKSVMVTISLPKDIPVGGYYSMIFFEPVLPHQTSASTIQSRIGILVLGDIGIAKTKTKKVTIVDFSLGEFIHETTTTPLLLRVANNGLHHISAKPRVVLTPFLGEKSSIWLEEKYVFPGKTRRWSESITLPTNLINFYKADIIVSIGNGEQEVATTFFLAFPLTQTGYVLLIGTLISLGLLRRKQIQHAVTILLTGEKPLDK